MLTFKEILHKIQIQDSLDDIYWKIFRKLIMLINLNLISTHQNSLKY